MFMKCHYQLLPFIFVKFNLEQIYFPKIQNIKKTKCMLKYYIETKNYCSKTKYSETSFLIQKQTTGKRTGCSVSKAIYELIKCLFFQNFFNFWLESK